jgi:signal transduction histidine kinase
VQTDISHDILRIKADLTQMQMVMSAIISNASEAIDGNGCIRIIGRNINITEENSKDFGGLKPGPYVNLIIEDDGKGMDEETRKRVFEPFFTTRSYGRGLGMAAAYGIIKNHSGCISINSENGKGTMVRFYLPAIQ